MQDTIQARRAARAAQDTDRDQPEPEYPIREATAAEIAEIAAEIADDIDEAEREWAIDWECETLGLYPPEAE